MPCAMFFFFNDTATTEIYTLSLHDALPIFASSPLSLVNYATREITCKIVYYGPGRSGKTTNLHYIYGQVPDDRDRKSTRLNSSHANISYAVFCLQKKNGKILLQEVV